MLQWEGVSEFVAVAEAGSFTAAARQLGISTAQASRQISALENRLVTKLLYRTTRKVSLTEAGQIYYRHCRQALNGLEEAERAMTDLQQTPQGTLRLTAPTTYGETRIAPLLNEFVSRYPALNLEIKLTNRKVDLIEEGFDLAIRLGPLEDSSLIAKRLATRRQYVCASPGYLADHGEPHSLSELTRHHCLQGTLDYWRFQQQGQLKTVKITGRIRCNSGQLLLDAALKGLGIVQLPDYYVQSYIEQGQLRVLLADLQPPEEGIWALYPSSRHLSPKVRMVVDFLSERLG